MTSSDSPTLTVAQRLAEQLSATATARTVYGEPVERNGTTVIPVARVVYGFGGGGGGRLPDAAGSGGGGGVVVTPVGYIELKEGATRFRPIRNSTASIIAVSGVVAWALLRALPKLWR